MELRKAKWGDIQKIWLIEIESRIYHKKITDRKYSQLNKTKINKKARLEFIKNFKKDLKKKKNLVLVAEEEKEIIGYVFAKFGKWGWSDNPPKTIWIEDVGVLKKYRRQGIARKLLKETEKIAKEKKMEYCYLTLWLKNKLAYNLYKKNKYTDFAIEMVKKLK